MSAPHLSLPSAAGNTGCAAPARAASHTPPLLQTPALSQLRGVPRIPVPLTCSLRLRKHRTKHPAAPTIRQGWVGWIAYHDAGPDTAAKASSDRRQDDTYYHALNHAGVVDVDSDSGEPQFELSWRLSGSRVDAFEVFNDILKVDEIQRVVVDCYFTVPD